MFASAIEEKRCTLQPVSRTACRVSFERDLAFETSDEGCASRAPRTLVLADQSPLVLGRVGACRGISREEPARHAAPPHWVRKNLSRAGGPLRLDAVRVGHEFVRTLRFRWAACTIKNKVR